MVLRDSYISGLLRSVSFTLVLLTFACQHSGTSGADPALESLNEAEKKKADAVSDFLILAHPVVTEMETTIQGMNGVFLTAQNLHMNSGGKGKAQSVDTETVDAVYEKSGITLGALFILKGSLDALVSRTKELKLDPKDAEEMLKKLRIDLESYKTSLKNYSEMLGTTEAEAPKAKK